MSDAEESSNGGSIPSGSFFVGRVIFFCLQSNQITPTTSLAGLQVIRPHPYPRSQARRREPSP